MSDRERLIEAIKKSWDKQNMTFDDIAQEIEAAGWVLPKPEAKDRETAREVSRLGGALQMDSDEAEARIAAALSAVRAQMQAKHAETIGALASVHRSYQDMHARATAAEAALERARAAAELCKLQPGPPKTNYEAGVREGIAIVCSAIQAAEMNASAALDPPTC